MYRLHDPYGPLVFCSLFELLEEDHVLTGHEIRNGEEVVLAAFLHVALLLQVPLELFEILVEHILAAELVVAPEVVNSAGRCHAVLLVNPVDLLLLAPNQIPVVALSLAPLSVEQPAENAVAKGRLELDVGAELAAVLTSGWGSVPS